MTETMTTKTTIATPLDPTMNLRILEEGYGPGAWHGADLRAALTDVSPRLAFWRPGPGRHNIAEIALQKKTAQEIEEFVIESVAMRFPEGLVNKSA